MSAAEKWIEPQAITKGEGPFQVQNELLLPLSVVNTPDFLRRCRIADINLQTPSAYRKQLTVGLNSLMACAVLPSSMSFDLARPRCVNEYDYCHRVADLDVMPEHDAPEDVSLALLRLSKPILRVGADDMPREGASTTDRNFEVPLGWAAQERKARHHIEAMVAWHRTEVLRVCRDYARRVYVNLPVFWEEWEVPFSFRAETPPLFAYRGFALNYYGSDDHRWWMALSEHAALCLKALYLEVMERSRLYWVPDNVRRAWRIMDVEGIFEGVQSEVTEKIIRLFGYVERIRWRVADLLNRQPPMTPGTFTSVYDNGDWVHFDVTQWAPVVPSSGMVAHAPVTESDRVAFQVHRGTRFYGNTRSWPRFVYPEGIPAHDGDMRKPGKYGLTRKPIKVAERALRGMLNGAGYYGPLRRLGMAEYPKFEDFVEMYGFLSYRARPDDVFFKENPGRVKDHWRVVAPAGSSAAEGDGAGPSGTQGGNAGSVPASDVNVVQFLSSVHLGGMSRALARRGRIFLESETGRV